MIIRPVGIKEGQLDWYRQVRDSGDTVELCTRGGTVRRVKVLDVQRLLAAPGQPEYVATVQFEDVDSIADMLLDIGAK